MKPIPIVTYNNQQYHRVHCLPGCDSINLLLSGIETIKVGNFRLVAVTDYQHWKSLQSATRNN